MIEIDHADNRIGLAAGDQAGGLDSDARSVDHFGDVARSLDPRLDPKRKRDDEDKRSVARHHQHGFRPVGNETGEPRHRGRPRVVGVYQKRVESTHQCAQPLKPRIEHRVRQLDPGACDQAAAHVRVLSSPSPSDRIRLLPNSACLVPKSGVPDFGWRAGWGLCGSVAPFEADPTLPAIRNRDFPISAPNISNSATAEFDWTGRDNERARPVVRSRITPAPQKARAA